MYASHPGAIPMIHELTHAFGIFLGDAMPNIGESSDTESDTKSYTNTYSESYTMAWMYTKSYTVSYTESYTNIMFLPSLGPAGFYSHWGITMHSDAPAKGDRIGQLGGYKRGAFKCKDGSIPSSAKGATKLYYQISILPPSPPRQRVRQTADILLTF